MLTLIGFGFQKQVGKNTASRYLVERHGFEQRAFAEPMRAMAKAINPYVNEFGQRLNDALKVTDYEGVKKQYPEFRRFLQALGTEAGRECLWDDIWVDTATRDLESWDDRRISFSDVRFPNEAQRIVDLGGYVVRIKKPGVEVDRTQHPSEWALADWNFDYTINNDSTITELTRQVEVVLNDVMMRNNARAGK